MLIELKYFLLTYIVAYITDLNSALYLRKKKPKVFNKCESNTYLKNAVERFGTKKGSLIYTLTYQLQIMLITFIAIFIPGKFIFNLGNIEIIEFFLAYNIILHGLGIVTNFLALILKKEEKIKQQQVGQETEQQEVERQRETEQQEAKQQEIKQNQKEVK